jgi:hypothetical protein
MCIRDSAVSISDDAELGEWVDVKSETFQLQHEEVQ